MRDGHGRVPGLAKATAPVMRYRFLWINRNVEPLAAARTALQGKRHVVYILSRI